MKAWVTGPAPGDLRLTGRPVPDPAADELLVRVEACGLCRTDLHVIDQELPVHAPGVVPGHQIVGTVVGTGRSVRHHGPGDRVGIAWLRATCGLCRWCREGRENLCPMSRYTGWDADGGFAEYTTVPEAFAWDIPAHADPVITAPLLCAGIIGYRALTRANLPLGGNLGIYGFGSSAQLTARLALAAGARLFVMTRGEDNRQLARDLGAVFTSDAFASPPCPLDSAIVFAPAGELVPIALRAVDRGGTVVLAGIHMTPIPALDYASTLFHERDLRSVTANTRADGAAFLRVAATLHLAPTVHRYSLAEVGDAITAIRSGLTSGSAVMVV